MTTLKCSIKSGVTAYGAPMTTSDTYYGENADKKKLAASSALWEHTIKNTSQVLEMCWNVKEDKMSTFQQSTLRIYGINIRTVLFWAQKV